MNVTRRDFLTAGLRLVLLLPVIPILALVIISMATDDDASPLSMTITILVLVALIVIEQVMHAFVSLRANSVRIGFMPFFWRTLPYREIARVDAVSVDPMRDYGGWGVKGKSRSERGMLFSAGGHYGVSITTQDGRRYLVTNREPMDDLVETLRTLTG